MKVKVLTAVTSALEDTQHYQLVSEVKKQYLSSIYWVFALQVGLCVVSVCWFEKEIALRQGLCRCIDQADPEPMIPLPQPSACCVTWILSANRRKGLLLPSILQRVCKTPQLPQKRALVWMNPWLRRKPAFEPNPVAGSARLSLRWSLPVQGCIWRRTVRMLLGFPAYGGCFLLC